MENPIKTWKLAKGVFKFPKLSIEVDHNKYNPWFHFDSRDLYWKPEDNFPVYVLPPKITLVLFKIRLNLYFGNDWKYWEELLWYYYYCDKNITKASNEWPWYDSLTKNSTWTDKYLVHYVDKK